MPIAHDAFADSVAQLYDPLHNLSIHFSSVRGLLFRSFAGIGYSCENAALTCVRKRSAMGEKV